MSQRIKLTSAWAKLRHAEEHMATLRAYIDTVMCVHSRVGLTCGWSCDGVAS
jgi:hypothetical protein